MRLKRIGKPEPLENKGREEGQVIIQQKSRNTVQLTNTGMESGMITGTALLAIQPDTAETPIECSLLLKVEGDKIYGCLMAHSSYHSKKVNQDFNIMHSGYISCSHEIR